MTIVAPDNYDLTTFVSLVACLSTGGVALWSASEWSLKPFVKLQARVIRLATAGSALLALVAGWLLIASPHFADLLPGDWSRYHAVIVDLSSNLFTGDGPSEFPDRALFLYLLASAQALFGTSGLISVIVNAILAGAIVLVLTDLARIIAGNQVATVTAVTAALLPALALWSGLPLREALTALLVVVGANIATRIAILVPGKPLRLAGGVASGGLLLPALFYTRRELLMVVVLALATGMVVNLWQRPAVRRTVWRPAVQIAIAGLALLVAIVAAPDVNRVAHGFAERAQTSFYLLHAATNTAIDPQPTLTPSSPSQAILDIPAATVRALFGPPPGPIMASRPHFLIDVLALWILAPFTAAGILTALARRQWPVVVVVFPALVWAAVCGLTLGNWGIVSRMRLSSWLLLLPFAALGLTETYWRIVARKNTAAVSPHDRTAPDQLESRTARRDLTVSSPRSVRQAN